MNSFWDPKAKKVGSVDNKKYEVKRFEIVTPSQIDRKMYDFIFPISVPGPFCPQMWEELANIESSSYDLIIATAYPYDHIIPAYLSSKRTKIPIITIPYLHLEYPELYLTGLRLAILNDSDAIVVSTTIEKNILLKYKIEEKKIKVIPPGLDLEFWNGGKKSERKGLGISENSIMILFAGTKSSVKGTINLIEALKDLWNSNTDIELVLIGQSMPDYETYFKKLETKFLSHIHDLGVISEDFKKNIFYDCDIFAMPSKSDSFGIVYLEAWVCSKPVIGCSIPAINEVITDGVDGILVDFEDKDQLVQAIKKLIQDQNLRQHLGNMGKNKVLQKYNAGLLHQTFESLCESLV
ncbi:MAG: glycosyltransferase family 4 protein [Nitrosotalea sp.]